MPTPQTRYSSGILAVMHSAQYLWITQYFARREQGAAWQTWRYWAAVVLGGLALFLPIPWLASYGAHVDFTASVLIVTAVVNLHHFMIDGVVLEAARPAGGARAHHQRRGRPGGRRFNGRWTIVAHGGGRSGHTGAGGVGGARPVALSPGPARGSRSAGHRRSRQPVPWAAQGRLLQALVAQGDDDAVRAHLEQAIARNPADVDAQVNAGVLAKRQGRLDDAARYWTEAVGHDPGLTHVQLYLAELLDEQDWAADAAVHYRAYLEQILAQRRGPLPEPATVVPVVLKFGDVLTRSGHAAEGALTVRAGRGDGPAGRSRRSRVGRPRTSGAKPHSGPARNWGQTPFWSRPEE